MAALCLLLGAVGWAFWVARFNLPPVWTIALVALIPWLHYATQPLFEFSAESFVFAFVPYALLATLAFTGRLRTPGVRWDLAAIALGLGFGAAYVLKYSAVLPMIGAGIYLTIVAARSRAFRRVVLVAAAGIIPIATVSLFNRLHGAAANLVSASVAPHIYLRSFAFALSNPVLMLTDADAFLRYVFRHPGHPLAASDDVLILFGLPGFVFLAWLVCSRGRTLFDAPGSLAITVATTTAALVLALWSLSSGVSFEARHVAAGSLAILPLVIRAGVSSWREGSSKLILIGGAGFYLALPVIHGVVSATAKGLRSSAALGSAHIANPLLSTSSIPSCVASMLDNVDVSHDLLYVTDPVTALDLPVNGRILIVHADFTDADILSRAHYSTSEAITVHLFLPQRFEQNPKGRIIRGSFSLADSQWKTFELPQCQVNRWSATVTPTKP